VARPAARLVDLDRSVSLVRSTRESFYRSVDAVAAVGIYTVLYVLWQQC
jgi:hypothetical protein